MDAEIGNKEFYIY